MVVIVDLGQNGRHFQSWNVNSLCLKIKTRNTVHFSVNPIENIRKKGLIYCNNFLILLFTLFVRTDTVPPPTFDSPSF